MSDSKEYEDLNVIRILLELWRHLQPRRKAQVGVLSLFMLFAGVAEMLSLGALVPFLGVLVAPEEMSKYEFVAVVKRILGIETTGELMLALTVSFCVAALAAGCMRLVMFWANGRLSQMVGFDIESEVYRRTIFQPYHVHVSRHTSEVITGVDKAKIAGGILLATLNMAGGIIIGTSIIATLFIINSVIAISTFAILGGIYLAISTFTRGRLRRNSIIVAAKRITRLKIMQESLGGIRDILLDGTQSYYLKAFRTVNLTISRTAASNLFMAQSPRVVVEMLGMITLSIVAYVLSQGSDFRSIVPVLGVLALGAQRLLPMLQQTYAGWAVLKSNQASMLDVLALLDQPEGPETRADRRRSSPFIQKIEFRNVGFRYRKDAPWVLRNFNMTIPKGGRIGLIGQTGGGKSTMLDLFMGLLSPTEGEILVDGKALGHTTRRAWQKNIAHVPQAIFLADGSIAENITFGAPSVVIDMDRVGKAAERAQIADFIGATPRNFDAHVGERGVRLSGGQRQRIGIARALYKQVPVLVLDEATNALDVHTEEKVVKAIEDMGRDVTLLIVSHRYSILTTCDAVYSLELGGKISVIDVSELA